MTRFFRVSLLAVLLLSAIAFFSSGCAKKPALLRIYFTTDDVGYLTPCG